MAHPTDSYELVTVVWHDAHADRSGTWVQIGDIDTDPYVVHSVGWLLPATKPDHVSIAQMVACDSYVDHVLHIPAGWIVAMRTIDPVGPPVAHI